VWRSGPACPPGNLSLHSHRAVEESRLPERTLQPITRWPPSIQPAAYRRAAVTRAMARCPRQRQAICERPLAPVKRKTGLTGYAPTLDSERNKLRKQLLAEMNFAGLPDFSRPITVVSREAIRTGKTTYPPPVPLEMMIDAGWPSERSQMVIVKSLDDPVEIQATPEERERFDRGEPLLVRANAFGMRPERSSGG
jgi:hypothetical protein